MSDSPESVVRRFLGTLEDPSRVDDLVSFFSDGAVYVDGPLGSHCGVDAIKSEFERQLAIGFGSVTIDVKALVADGGTVMMERVVGFSLDGKPFSMEVMTVFEIDAEGRITRWRDSFDQKSITYEIEAAGISVP
jgi:limonene-1,2-epoxide hydrolase